VLPVDIILTAKSPYLLYIGDYIITNHFIFTIYYSQDSRVHINI